MKGTQKGFWFCYRIFSTSVVVMV